MVSTKKVSGLKICAGLVTLTGLVILTHAAYSAVQHRAYLRITEQEFSSLPLDIIVQALLSVLITVLGITFATNEVRLMEATKGLENKSIESLTTAPSFYSFRHRMPRMLHENGFPSYSYKLLSKKTA